MRTQTLIRTGFMDLSQQVANTGKKNLKDDQEDFYRAFLV